MRNVLLLLFLFVSSSAYAQNFRPLSGRIEAETFDANYGAGTGNTEDAGGGLDVGWMNDSSYLDYHVYVPETGIYNFRFRIANGFSDNATIQVKSSTGAVLAERILPRTGGMQAWQTVTAFVSLSAGNQTIRIYTKQGVYAINWFEASRSNVSVPGKIEAEHFDVAYGVSAESTGDEGGGQNVGFIDDNDWLDYNINVSETGLYKFYFRVANAWGDGLIQIKINGGASAGEVSIPRTGAWHNYVTVAATAQLNAGDNVIRIFANRGAFNLNWMEILQNTALRASAKTLPAKVQAENFDNASGIQTEGTGDGEGNLNISSIDDSDWIDYHVNAQAAGPYLINFRVASAIGGCELQVKNSAGNTLGSITIPWTGGWQAYQSISTTIPLAAGPQLLRLFASKGGFNLNWFEVSSSTNPQGVITFAPLTPRVLGDEPFLLQATSTNQEVPVTFASSNPSVISVANNAGTWIATVTGEGTATITASQSASSSFLSAPDVSQNQVVTNATTSKIAIDGNRWYQLTNASSSLAPLFDGNTQVNLHTGWGKVINDYEAYYPLSPGEQMTIESIRFFDMEGSAPDAPTTLAVITDQWERIEIASFKGYQYNGWVGPDPESQLSGSDRFKLSAPVGNIRYLVLKFGNAIPTEIEIYGDHTASTQTPAAVPHKSVRLGDMFGVNGYEWNFESPFHPDVIDETLMTAAKSFSGVRHYMDWQKLEAAEGVYSYNPTLAGGWNYDAIYERCKAENIEVLACLKTLPDWMQATYPAEERDNENVPVRYGKNFADPVSYIEQARVAFQYAARYGSNVNVDPSLLSTHSTPRWYGDSPNVVKIGLNLIKYIECDNERDKWWKGRKGYQTAREYAANLSAFYDGHKNTMGPGVGIKNADPNMKVVIAGLVTGPDYVKGMVDWCREFRGYKPDGSVNLCWDVVNFHLYIDDASMTQSGTSTRGVGPETVQAGQIMRDFVKVSYEVSQGMPVWLTETGYDLNQGSPLKAIAIGNKSAEITQADWTLRTSLLSARTGLDKVFFYQMYDDNGGPGMFGSSGLINENRTRRPAADYLYQVNARFGNYRYVSTLQSDPIIDQYELDGKKLYIVTVPDEIGRTEEVTLDFAKQGVAKVYTPQAGSDLMAIQELPLENGKVTVTAGETPIFVIAADQSNVRMAATEIAEPISEEELMNAEVNIYPNPAFDFISIDLANKSTEHVEVKVFDAKSGLLHRDTSVAKHGHRFSHKMHIGSLPPSIYIVEIRHGNELAYRKIAKMD